jgi:hypothetical protein
MDHSEHIPEVEHSDNNVPVVHRRPVEPGFLNLLQLDYSKMRELALRYGSINVPREHLALFERYLLAGDTWFVEVGDVGLFYLTNVVPTYAATFNTIFWDRKFGRARRILAQDVIATAFAEFELERMAAFVPETSVLAQVEYPKIGFKREGVMRKAWKEARGACDLFAFGMLRDEVDASWSVIPELRVT